MMVFAVAGSPPNRNCISSPHCSYLALYICIDFYRYSRFGNELLLLPSLISSIPPTFLDGELWYFFFVCFCFCTLSNPLYLSFISIILLLCIYYFSFSFLFLNHMFIYSQ